LALTGVVLLVIPLVRSFALVLALTFIWALVADAARPATMSALADAVAPEQRKAAIALNRLAINLGMSVGPAVGGFLALVSFPLIFVVDGLTSLIAAAVLSALLWMRHRSRGPAAKHGRAPHPASERPPFSTHSMVWRDRAALLFFATSFLMNLVFAQHQGAMPLYLVRDLHYRESFYGMLFLVNTALIVAIEVPLNIATAHWSPRRAIPLAVMLVAIGFGALGIARAPIPIVITVIIWTFGEMMFFPTAAAYVAELAPAGRTGEYMGGLSATFSLALILGPWAGAAMLDHFGSAVTWGSVFVCGAVGAALYAFKQASISAANGSRYRAV